MILFDPYDPIMIQSIPPSYKLRKETERKQIRIKNLCCILHSPDTPTFSHAGIITISSYNLLLLLLLNIRETLRHVGKAHKWQVLKVEWELHVWLQPWPLATCLPYIETARRYRTIPLSKLRKRSMGKKRGLLSPKSFVLSRCQATSTLLLRLHSGPFNRLISFQIPARAPFYQRAMARATPLQGYPSLLFISFKIRLGHHLLLAPHPWPPRCLPVYMPHPLPTKHIPHYANNNTQLILLLIVLLLRVVLLIRVIL